MFSQLKPLLNFPFLCILVLCYNIYNEGHASALVHTTLPGFEGTLPFYLETGYVSVDEENGTELFYYFIESEGNPSEDPLLVWLTGGPGCSGLSGLAFETGPLKFVNEEYDGINLPKLVYFPTAWTKLASIIFLDAPVGTGFSVTRNPQSYHTGDFSSSKQTHKFVLKWLNDHPHFQKNDFYVAGDSYAGKVVPLVSQYIIDGAEASTSQFVNFKGYMIGNPLTGDIIDNYARFPYAQSHGLISDDFNQLAMTGCKGQNYKSPRTADCANCVNTFEKVIGEIEQAHILEPLCANDLVNLKGTNQNRRSISEKQYFGLSYPAHIPEVSCRSYGYYLAIVWANSEIVREALNIKKGTVETWKRCVVDIPYTEDLPSSIPLQFNLTRRGYRTLVYSGDQDMIVPFVGTYEWVKSFNYSVVDRWRSWHVGGQVAGYTISYANSLTLAIIRGGGHTAPEYKPEECLAMFNRWLANEPL